MRLYYWLNSRIGDWVECPFNVFEVKARLGYKTKFVDVL